MSEPEPIFGQPILATERAGNLIAHEIRRAIVEGRVEPGDVLREEQLARELGTSRTPVREALIELRNEGLVEATATRRAVVRAYDASELHDIYALRAVLEGHAARLAAERATDATIRRLEASLDRFRELSTHDGDALNALVAENLVFHGVIADAVDVPHLKRMIDQVMVIPRRYRAYAAYVPEHRLTVADHHAEITDAIQRRNGDAAAALMEHHVRWTGEVAVAAQER
ncbi:Transcriptional regulator [Gaiella occulta]|uniref:Transcriptional regulator n=1 Tax=Gaiella occulta TaxID=1002870 RepID=A0A7M2YXH8_9ACTN|nr:GntR family transcriptional regulator [Gaiella occulta]RDI74756.1 Transcriptional regulator [Gaiella occulta]